MVSKAVTSASGSASLRTALFVSLLGVKSAMLFSPFFKGFRSADPLLAGVVRPCFGSSGPLTKQHGTHKGMGFDYKMKKSENGGILRGFWAIAVLWLVIWREQNCSSGGKSVK
jgi:hypothetical protein